MTAPRVTIVDYGMGNLLSVARAFEHRGAAVTLGETPEEIMRAESLVLTGVGAFADCVAGLRIRGLIAPVKDFIVTGRPMLGICVGMQILLDEGEEFGRHRGLGVIPGRVVAIPKTTAEGAPHKVPHIGWTAIHPPDGAEAAHWAGTPLEDVAPGAAVYFVHSYTAQPTEPATRLADCYYNGRLVSAAIRKDNVTATQFHPEKSGETGLRIVGRFLDL